MKASPIQTKSIVYGEFCIEPVNSDGDSDSVESFDWNGVQIRTSTRHGESDQDGKKSYPLFLRIEVSDEGKSQPPYTVKASIMGLFTYVGNKTGKEALDLVVVNGLSILYSSLRETVLGMTTRMINGPLCLPGANFMDHAPSLDSQKTVSKKPSTKKQKVESKPTVKD